MLARYRETVALLQRWWEREMVQPLWETIRHVLIKLNLYLTHDPAIPPPGDYPWKMKIYIYIKPRTQIASLFIIAPDEKQPKYPSRSKQINCGKSILLENYQQKKKRKRYKLLIHVTTEWTAKKPVSQGDILHNPIYMAFLKKTKQWGADQLSPKGKAEGRVRLQRGDSRRFLGRWN